MKPVHIGLAFRENIRVMEDEDGKERLVQEQTPVPVAEHRPRPMMLPTLNEEEQHGPQPT